MATIKFIEQDPSKPGSNYAARISDTQWRQHEPSIRRMFAAGYEQKRMLSELKDQYDFCPSVSQLNARLGVWGLRRHKPGLPSPPDTSSPASVDATLSSSKSNDGEDLTLQHETSREIQEPSISPPFDQRVEPSQKDARLDTRTEQSVPYSSTPSSMTGPPVPVTTSSTVPGVVVREEANGTESPWQVYGYSRSVFGHYLCADKLYVPVELLRTFLGPFSFNELQAADAERIENRAEYLCALGSYTDAFDLYHLLFAFQRPKVGDVRPVVASCVINCARTASATNQRSVARMLANWCLELCHGRPNETLVVAALHRCLSRLYIAVDHTTSIMHLNRATAIASSSTLPVASLSNETRHRELLALSTLSTAGLTAGPSVVTDHSGYYTHSREMSEYGELGKYLVRWCGPVLARNIATFFTKLESYQGTSGPVEYDPIQQKWDIAAALFSLFLESWLKQLSSQSVVVEAAQHHLRYPVGFLSPPLLVNEAFAALAFMIVDAASVPAADHIRRLIQGIQELERHSDSVLTEKFAEAYISRVVTRPFAASEPTLRSAFEKYRPAGTDLAGSSANLTLDMAKLPLLPQSVNLDALVQIFESKLGGSKSPGSKMDLSSDDNTSTTRRDSYATSTYSSHQSDTSSLRDFRQISRRARQLSRLLPFAMRGLTPSSRLSIDSRESWRLAVGSGMSSKSSISESYMSID